MKSDPNLKTLFRGCDRVPQGAYIIAEIGINHEGNVERCAEMVEAFSKAGANAIKLQTVDAERAYAPDTDSYKIFSQASLTQEETGTIFDLARKHKVEPFTTSGDIETLDLGR